MQTIEVNLKEWVLLCSKCAALEKLFLIIKEIKDDDSLDDWNKGNQIGQMIMNIKIDDSILAETVERCLDEA